MKSRKLLIVAAVVLSLSGIVALRYSESPALEAQVRQQPLGALPTTVYSQSWELRCNDFSCYLVLWSGTRYIFEGKEWVPVEEAATMKGVWTVHYETVDKDFPLEVAEYNYSGIMFRPTFKGDWSKTAECQSSVSSSIDATCDFSVEVLEKNDKGDLLLTSEILVALNVVDDVAETKEIWVPGVPLGKFFKFGGNSTIVILEEVDTEVTNDAAVSETHNLTEASTSGIHAAGYHTYASIDYYNLDAYRINVSGFLRELYVPNFAGIYPVNFTEIDIRTAVVTNCNSASSLTAVVYAGTSVKPTHKVSEGETISCTTSAISLALSYPIGNINGGYYWIGIESDSEVEISVDDDGYSPADLSFYNGTDWVGYNDNEIDMGIDYESGKSTAFFQFNLSGLDIIPGDITNVTLHIYNTDKTGGPTLHFHQVQSSWTEENITWGNQPAVLIAELNSLAISAENYFMVFNATGANFSDGGSLLRELVSFSINSTSGMEGVDMNTKEWFLAAERPYLNISFRPQGANLTILEPTTSNPETVSYPQEITINFTMGTETENFTADVEVDNVTIGGEYCEISTITYCQGSLSCKTYPNETACNDCSQCNWTGEPSAAVLDFEDFEGYSEGTQPNPIGNWTQATFDTDDWYVFTGSGQSSSTGPEANYDGYYAMVETSVGYCTNPDTAVLYRSPFINFDDYDEVNLHFAYNMYGSTMGNLTVQENSTGSWVPHWYLSGNQGTDWFTVTVNFTGLAGEGAIAIWMYCGNSYTSDAAVDSVNLTGTSGGCSNIGSCDSCETGTCEDCNDAGCSLETAPEFAYIENGIWQVNCSIPEKSAGSYDLFLNATYDEYLTANSTQVDAITYEEAGDPTNYSRTAVDYLVVGSVGSRQQGLFRVFSDQFSLVDAELSQRVLVRLFTGSFTLAEFDVRALELTRLFVDQVTIADAQVRAAAYSRAFSGSVTLVDVTNYTLTAFTGYYHRASVGVLSLVAVPVRAVNYLRSFIGSVTVADVVARGRDVVRISLGSISLSESQVRAAEYWRSWAGSVTVADTALRSVVFPRTFAGSFLMVDAQVLNYTTFTGIYSRVATAFISLVDAPVRVIHYGRSFVESLSLGNTTFAQRAVIRWFTDSFSLSDTQSRSMAYVRILVDKFTLVDVPKYKAIGLQYFMTAVAAISLVALPVRSVVYTRLFSDMLQILPPSKLSQLFSSAMNIFGYTEEEAFALAFLMLTVGLIVGIFVGHSKRK